MDTFLICLSLGIILLFISSDKRAHCQCPLVLANSTAFNFSLVSSRGLFDKTFWLKIT